MSSSDKISRRQLLALAFVVLLSPVARRFPSSLVMVSGTACWLAVAVAVPALIIMIAFFSRLLRGGRDLAQVFELSLGKVLGRTLIIFVSLWLVFYSGFVLRSAAYRFTSTAYPNAGAWIFIIFSAAVCLPLILGSFSAIARMAVLVRPLLLAALGLVFAFSLTSCDFTGLFALSESDTLPVLRSGFTVLNTLSVACYLGFAESHCDEPFRPRRYVLWGLILLAITELLCLCCLGIFGAELTVKLNYPFFMLVRDVGVFNSFARMEALIIALWIVADAIHTAMLLHIAASNISRCLRIHRGRTGLALSVLAAAAGLLMPAGMLGVGLFSETVVPLGNAVIFFALLPFTALVGWIRRKI